jgi:hypothetical protein
MLRRMDRKDVVTAPHLDEWCQLWRAEGASCVQSVSFTPVFPPWVEHDSFRKPVMSYLPYNYPKSLRYTFYYLPPQPGPASAASGSVCDGTLRMTAHLFDGGSREFLTTTAHRMLNKVDKWARCVQGVGASTRTCYQKRVTHDSLVEQAEFRREYQQLKDQHKHWAKEWPEKTDPQKFVFEETGIAAYLIALWR